MPYNKIEAQKLNLLQKELQIVNVHLPHLRNNLSDRAVLEGMCFYRM